MTRNNSSLRDSIEPVIVEDYNPQWPNWFETIRARIWPVVSGVALSMEHVGSTSVPGLAAKPIIDIDLVIASPSDLNEIISRLRTLGYEHRGSMGIEGREVFRWIDLEPQYSHHLYVCAQGCLALKNHLLLRDYLREHPEARDQYSKIKKNLAIQFPDSIDSYVDGKTEFILEILKTQGLNEEQVESISKVNQLPRS